MYAQKLLQQLPQHCCELLLLLFSKVIPVQEVSPLFFSAAQLRTEPTACLSHLILCRR
jgi:hypothetical protein